jgi:hypothetical protein
MLSFRGWSDSGTASRIPPFDRQLLMQIAELMAKRADKPA